MSKHVFNYQWYLKDGYDVPGIKKHNSKVFGTFVCGGGSAMGYKLAGYDDLGGVELDQKVAAIFKENLNPKYLYVEDIRDFNKREDLPDELYDLDLLDGSPPCSTFSTAGKREEGWNKAKKFAEGQKLQRLDDLVFVYCDTINKLKPKVCLLENVSGLVKGNARAYAKQIIEKMTEAGYRTQLFLLNAAKMGVPQTRQRVFFIGLRNDFNLPKLKLDFNEEPKTAWFIDSQGDIQEWRDADCDDWTKEKAIGNYFETKEEAEQAVEKLKAWKRLKDKGFRFEGIKEDFTRILQSQEPFRTGKRYLQFNKSEDEEWMEENWKDLDLLFGGEE